MTATQKQKKVHYADMSYVADPKLKDNGIIKYKWLFKDLPARCIADEEDRPPARTSLRRYTTIKRL